MSVIQLECQCNNYDWGKTGSESLAAKYAAATPGGHFKLDSKKEYAEMWMGTYPTTPSLALSSGENLQKHINANKEKLIGKPILNKFGADLPYLPKVDSPNTMNWNQQLTPVPDLVHRQSSAPPNPSRQGTGAEVAQERPREVWYFELAVK